MPLFIALLLLTCSIPAFGDDKPFIAPIGKDGIQHVEIVAGDYYFRPNHIVVKVNVPVELKTYRETVLVPHDLVIQAPEAGIVIEDSLGRTPKTYSFVPSKTGSFSFYCDKKLPFMKSHRERGMEGVLEVVK